MTADRISTTDEVLSDSQQLNTALWRASAMSGQAAKLPPQQRLALALTYATGQTIGDVARILGVSRRTVMRQLVDSLRGLSVAYSSLGRFSTVAASNPTPHATGGLPSA